MIYRIAAVLMMLSVVGLSAGAQNDPTITVENAQHLEFAFSTDFLLVYEDSPTAALAMAYSNDDARLVIVTLDQRILMFDTDDGDVLWEEDLDSLPLSITFSPDDAWLLMTDDETTIRTFEAVTGDEISEFDYNDITDLTTLGIRDDQITFMADSKLYIATLDDGEISDEVTEIDLQRFQDGNQVLYSPDGELLVTYGPGIIRTWETSTLNNAEIRPLATRVLEDISEVSFTTDGSHLVVTASQGVLVLHTKTLVSRHTLTEGFTFGMSTTSSGSLVALGNLYNSVGLWDAARGIPIAYLPTEFYVFVYPVVFNHAHTTLAVATSQGQVLFYTLGDLDTNDFLDRAEELQYLGEYQGASLDYARVLEDEPDNEDALLGREIAYFNLFEYSDAFNDFETLLEIDDENADAYFWRGRTHYQLGAYRLAIADISQALELDFDDRAWAYLIRGLAYDRSGNYWAALDDMTASIELAPNYEAAYNNRAFIYYYRYGDWEKALEDHRIALEINPNYINYNRVAWDLVQLGEYEEALDMANESLDIEPAYAAAIDTRGWAYLGLKEYDSAIEDFEAAIELGEPYSHYGLGKVYWELGDNVSAVEHLKTYVDIFGTDAEDEARELITKIEQGETFDALDDGKVGEPTPAR